MLSALIETGVSDFHKMVVTVLKSCFRKHKAKITKYRSNKSFCKNLNITVSGDILCEANNIKDPVLNTLVLKQ